MPKAMLEGEGGVPLTGRESLTSCVAWASAAILLCVKVDNRTDLKAAQGLNKKELTEPPPSR